MTKSSNTINLFSAVDSLFDYITTDIVTNTGGTYFTTPSWYDPITTYTKWDTVTLPKIDAPSYPVSNAYIDTEDKGTYVLEIAVTGFTKDQLAIERYGQKLTIKGQKDKNDKENKKYIYNNIAQRAFDLTFKCGDKLDLSKIKSKLDNGILEIRIPLQEQHVPEQEVIEIE